MKNLIISGISILIIGGSSFAISQADVADNFANETGMTQQEAHTYVTDSQDELASFDSIGNELVAGGTKSVNSASEIDCSKYHYQWESESLGCYSGAAQLRTIGNSEIQLGNCYIKLSANLSGDAKSIMTECMADIDSLNASYDLPIVSVMFDTTGMTEIKNSNLYNKSVLKTALNS